MTASASRMSCFPYVAAILLAACGNAGGAPSDTVVEEVIRAAASRDYLAVPCMQPQEIRIERFEIMQRGEPSGSGFDRSWPVRVRYTGTCPAASLWPAGSFDRRREYRISRDPYGEWRAMEVGF